MRSPESVRFRRRVAEPAIECPAAPVTAPRASRAESAPIATNSRTSSARPRRHEHVPHARAPRARRASCATRSRRCGAATTSRSSSSPSRPARGYPRGRARTAPRATARRRFDVVHAHFGLTRLARAARPPRARRGDAARQRPAPPALEARSRAPRCRSSPCRRRLARVQREPPGRGHARGAWRCCPVGIDTRALPPDPAREARARLGLDPDEPVPAVPARPRAPLKRHDRAREAAGDAPLLHAGRRRAGRGPATGSTPPTRCSCPSEAEGFGLAVIEALACDVPVLGTPVGIHPVALRRHRRARSAPPWDARPGAPRCAPHLEAADPRVRRPRARRAVLRRPHGRARGRGLARAGRSRGAASYTRPTLGASRRAPRRRMNGLSAPARGRARPPTRPIRPGARRPATPPRLRRGRTCHADEAVARQDGSRRRRDLPAGLDGDRASTPVATTPRRGALRRRLRYLRRVREVLLRDLGGLVFEVHRAASAAPADRARRGKLERARRGRPGAARARGVLDDRPPASIVREPGIGGTCPRCGELHGSDARFCSSCGTPLSGRRPQAGRARPPTARRRARPARRGGGRRRPGRRRAAPPSEEPTSEPTRALEAYTGRTGEQPAAADGDPAADAPTSRPRRPGRPSAAEQLETPPPPTPVERRCPRCGAPWAPSRTGA